MLVGSRRTKGVGVCCDVGLGSPALLWGRSEFGDVHPESEFLAIFFFCSSRWRSMRNSIDTSSEGVRGSGPVVVIRPGDFCLSVTEGRDW